MIHMSVFPIVYVKEHQRKHTVPQMTYITSSANQNTAIKANQLPVIFIKQSNFLIAKITIIKKEFFNTTIINVKHNIQKTICIRKQNKRRGIKSTNYQKII